MKGQTDIEDRVRFLLCEELSRRVREAESRLPHMCSHNHRQPLDTRKTVEDAPNDTYNRVTDHHGLPVVQSIGLCMLNAETPEQWQGTICEDPIDAQKCPWFTPAATKLSIFYSYKSDVENVEWVRAHMPELYGLIWVLDQSTWGLPFWKRLWFKLLRIQVAPVLSNAHVINQLPAPPEE
jgi:hypothetical protein